MSLKTLPLDEKKKKSKQPSRGRRSKLKSVSTATTTATATSSDTDASGVFSPITFPRILHSQSERMLKTHKNKTDVDRKHQPSPPVANTNRVLLKLSSYSFKDDWYQKLHKEEEKFSNKKRTTLTPAGTKRLLRKLSSHLFDQDQDQDQDQDTTEVKSETTQLPSIDSKHKPKDLLKRNSSDFSFSSDSSNSAEFEANTSPPLPSQNTGNGSKAKQLLRKLSSFTEDKKTRYQHQQPKREDASRTRTSVPPVYGSTQQKEGQAKVPVYDRQLKSRVSELCRHALGLLDAPGRESSGE